MYVHVFGTYFGIATSMVYSWYNVEMIDSHKKNKSDYYSIQFAYIGSLFLWLFWPSINSAGTSGNQQQRIIINTFMGLTGSAMAAFLISPILHQTGKYKVGHLLNATFVGAVGVGTTCDVLGSPWISIFIGFLSGIISVIGFVFFSPCLEKTIRLYDTAGINNTHGLPGIFGALIGIVYAKQATAAELGISLTIVFPQLGVNSTRTPAFQAGMQAAALIVSFSISIAGGIITGLILRNQDWFYGPSKKEDIFNDILYFDELEQLEKLDLGEVEDENLLSKINDQGEDEGNK